LVTTNDLKSEFSIAYTRAIAHAAGYFVQEANRMMDADGVDLTIFSRGAGGVTRSPRLDLQIKSTSNFTEDDPFAYDLDVKNYHELRAVDLQVPRILLVVLVPEQRADWVQASLKDLTLRHCGFWHSLRGVEGFSNTTTKRIFIERANCFHVDALATMMQRIREGQLP
jgi:hypothetical protein